MKASKFILIIWASLISITSIAQAPPQGINYQAVAVDENGREIVGVVLSKLCITIICM